MQHEIIICMGSSCFARGNHKYLRLIERFLADHSLADSVALKGSRCEDHCSTSPHIRIDGVLYDDLTETRLMELLLPLITEHIA